MLSIILIALMTKSNIHISTSGMMFHKTNNQPQIVIPSSFSPNKDGIDDLFIIKDIESYPQNALYIFERSGVLVYHCNDYKNNWGGVADNGRMLQDDIYFYVFDDGKGHKFSSYIKIIIGK